MDDTIEKATAVVTEGGAVVGVLLEMVLRPRVLRLCQHYTIRVDSTNDEKQYDDEDSVDVEGVSAVVVERRASWTGLGRDGGEKKIISFEFQGSRRHTDGEGKVKRGSSRRTTPCLDQKPSTNTGPYSRDLPFLSLTVKWLKRIGL